MPYIYIYIYEVTSELWIQIIVTNQWNCSLVFPLIVIISSGLEFLSFSKVCYGLLII
jgi:hypothetical protein